MREGFASPAPALAPVDDAPPLAIVLFGVELALLDAVFLKDFFPAFLGAFFATAFFTDFLTVFLACFVLRVLFFARFFNADPLAVRARADVRACFALRFLTLFFLAFATTNSSIA
jgi:hypothetical protein